MISLATSAADADAIESIEQHHAQLAGTLAVLVEGIVDGAIRGEGHAAEEARRALVRWCEDDLVPHAEAEEDTLYPPAHALPEGRLLITGMIDEHRVLAELIDSLGSTPEPVRAAALATAIQVLFRSHVSKENELLLPLLAGSADVAVAGLLDGMHELLGGAHEPLDGRSEPDHHAVSGSGCGCHDVESGAPPELDARQIPHAIRHATIFGALEAVAQGDGLVLVAPHDPLPLLAQIEQRWSAVFDVSYLERGPDAWRLQFLRR